MLPTSVSDTRDIAFYGCYNWKGPILNAGPSGNFLIADHPKEDHNEQEFKRLIIGGILDQLEKSSKTREASYKWSRIKYVSIKTWPSQNVIWNNSSIQMWSTSKDWKTNCVLKTGPTEEFLQNKRSTLISSPPLKIKNQITAYRWTFGKDPLNLEKFCEQYNWIWYNTLWCNDEFPENVHYWNWWKLSALIENYIMEVGWSSLEI